MAAIERKIDIQRPYRIRFRASCVVAGVFVLFAAALPLSAFPSKASAAATEAWSHPISDLAEVAVAPNGSLLVPGCNGTESKGYTSTGSEAWSTDLQPLQCLPHRGTYDRDGNFYMFTTTSTAPNVALTAISPQGQVRWTQPLRFGAGLWESAPAIGPDGYVYIADAAEQPFALRGFRLTDGAPGLDTGDINTGASFPMFFGAWTGGLISVSPYNGVTYFGYDGVRVREIPLPTQHRPCGFTAAQGPDGTILYATPTRAAGLCGQDGPLAVSRFWPDGTVRTWEAPTAGEGGTGLHIRAQPDGGAVLGVDAQTWTGSNSKLISLDPTMSSVRWSADLGSDIGNFLNEYSYASLRVDISNHVLAAFTRTRDDPNCPAGDWFCPVETLTTVLDGITGGTQESVVTPGTVGSLSVGQDRIYLTALVDNATLAPTASLFAVDMAGISDDFALSLVPASTPPPPPPPPPVITGDAIIANAAPTDLLLKRGVTFRGAPGSSGAPIARYEYGWTQTAGATEPNQPWQTYVPGSGPATIDFRAATPNARWILMLRAVDENGIASDWHAQPIDTPKKPLLIALGDSITSGHHRDKGVGGSTVCDDPGYSYAATTYARFQGAMPSTWRRSTGYFNLAHSGFNTVAVVQGNTRNACGEQVSGSPLATAKTFLQNNARALNGNTIRSWDRVVMTVGINNTNWTKVVSNVVKRYMADPRYYNSTKCQNDVNSWNGFSDPIYNSIKSGVAQIVQGLRGADPAVRIAALGYYNIAGTGTEPGRVGPAVPAYCGPAIQKAVDRMKSALKAALPLNVPLLGTNAALGNQDRYVQHLYIKGFTLDYVFGDNKNPPGWPHPNTDGAKLIGSLVVP